MVCATFTINNVLDYNTNDKLLADSKLVNCKYKEITGTLYDFNQTLCDVKIDYPSE